MAAATAAGAVAHEPLAPPSTLQRNLNLARELAWTQFKLKYTGSVLGYLWSLVKPLMLFAVMYTIFVVFFKQRSSEFPLQLLVGIVVFTFFTDCVGAGMGSLASNGHLIRKAFFPRWILVISSSMTASMTFLINFTLIIIVGSALGHVHLGLRSLVAIPLLFELYMFALGLSLLLASLFVFYRDLGHIWEILSFVLFYGSAVVYPLAIVPARWLGLFIVNPLTQIIEDMRHAIVTTAVPWSPNVISTAASNHGVSGTVGAIALIPMGISIACLALGIIVFRRLAPVVAENV